MNEKAAEAYTHARTTLVLGQPFFGMLALRLTPIQKPEIKTLAVDGKHIYYNPDFFLSLSSEVRRSAIAHEVMHCVLDHMSRISGRVPDRWNRACDFALNPILADANFSIPSTWLMSPAYAGMSADEIYTLLPPEDDDNGDALDEMQQPSPEAQQMQAADWKIATIQAANAAKSLGMMPGALGRFVEKALTPKIDWKAELRRFISERSKDDYSWQRPNKMMLQYDLFIPSLYSESMGEIVIGVDVSGSIDDRTLSEFSSEVSAIFSETRPVSVHVVYCDSEVAHVDVFQRHDEIKLAPHGGGGTAFKPVFDYVTENDLKPVCLIYLTDLYGNTSFEQPDYPTLWCCTTSEVAPWGTTIRLEV